jgi:hypothetical protein
MQTVVGVLVWALRTVGWPPQWVPWQKTEEELLVAGRQLDPTADLRQSGGSCLRVLHGNGPQRSTIPGTNVRATLRIGLRVLRRETTDASSQGDTTDAE